MVSNQNHVLFLLFESRKNHQVVAKLGGIHHTSSGFPKGSVGFIQLLHYYVQLCCLMYALL